MTRSAILPALALFGAALGAAAMTTATAARAAEPVPLGTFSDWRAYKLDNGANTICYALSQPKDTEPKNVRRGEIYVMVSNWPGRKVKGEVKLSSQGILDPKEDGELLSEIAQAVKEEGESAMQQGKRKALDDRIRAAIRRIIRNELGKKPVLDVHIHEVK